MTNLNYYYAINEKDRKFILFIENNITEINDAYIENDNLKIISKSNNYMLSKLSFFLKEQLTSKETDVVLIDSNANFIGEFTLPILDTK